MEGRARGHGCRGCVILAVVNYKQRTWLLVALLGLFCGAAIWGIAFLRSEALRTPQARLKRLPTRDAIVVFIDFEALRRAGLVDLLNDSPGVEEPDYQEFVSKTDFNYLRDLDSAIAAFAPDGKFFVVSGRFDWSRLRSYAKEQKGDCRNAVCWMTGSAPDRQISFFPLQSSLMALAVSRDSQAVSRLQDESADRRPIEIPAQPVWMSIPPAVIRDRAALPEGTRMFTRGLENAADILLTIGPKGQDFELGLRVGCRSEQEAGALTEDFGRTTSTLRRMISRENQQPNPRDLSGVLTAGRFRQAGKQMIGTWPIQRIFLRELLRNAS